MMQSVSRRYVGFFNLTMDRTGALWESRYDSRRVDSENYLLRCYRYIELNPVRAGIVRDPQHFPWSSFRCNALGHADPLVTPHPGFRSIGNTDMERRSAYRAFVGADCALADANEVRQLGRPRRGRPRKTFENE
jgi:putative transposase